jgi:hypothetical protein
MILLKIDKPGLESLVKTLSEHRRSAVVVAEYWIVSNIESPTGIQDERLRRKRWESI